MPSFAHLAARTCYSLRNAVIRPGELAVAAAERGMDAVGVADRSGLYGAVRLAQACEVVGIRLILGTDLALLPNLARPGWESTRYGRVRPSVGDTRIPQAPASGAAWLEDDAARVTLIARTEHGYANLCRTVTDHHLESARADPHVTWEQLERRVGGSGGQVDSGMFVLLGDQSSVARLLDAGRVDAAENEARHWMDLAGPSSVLIGVTHHLARGDDQRARVRFGLADRLGLRAVANQAPRYLDPADARIADVMDAVRQQVPVDPRHSSRRNAEGYFKTPAQMARVFAERPDALRNAALVADACRVDLGLGRLRVPDFVASGPQAEVELRSRCEAGLNERYAGDSPRPREVLEAELAMIARLGLAPYFLTVAEIVDRIREKGIMAACRGSAAGSIVTYALRVSDVDPIAHDLVFERFANPYRDELPDIDIDVEASRRDDIYRDLIDRYGDDRVACVCMVERFKARMAIRDVGKALGLPAGEVDYVAKSFPHVRAGDVRAAMEHLPEMRGLNLDRTDLALLFDVVERMDAFPRHIALHPSGVLLADRTLRDLVPLERSATRGAGTGAPGGYAMAQFDKDDVEALGLCKLDVLSVRMLSSMASCVEQVRRTRGVELDLTTVRWDDPDTYELIRSTRTLGCFQIESPGQRELVGKFQPEHLDDLVVDISLFRPGPVKGDMVGPFLQRRLGQSEVVYPHPLLEAALSETFGVIVYHEQVMRCVAAVTGCDLATADLVRRRLGDPEKLDGLHSWILAGARKRGLEEQVAESLWHALCQFASFGFCKAHAAAFAVPTYRSAWLKTHYLPEFVAGLLTHDPGMYPRRLLLDDARQFGVAVLALDVNRSGREYHVERVPAAQAYALLGVGAGFLGIRSERRAPSAHRMGAIGGKPSPAAESWGEGLPPGWSAGEDGTLLPPAGFDKGADPADPRWRFAVRLGLQDVAGIDDRMIDSLLTARPFESVADLRRRSALSAPVAEALAHAGALDGIGGGEVKRRTRRELLLEVTERWSGVTRHRPPDPTAPQQLALIDDDSSPGLTEYRPSEKVRAELEVLGLDVSAHVIRFYDGLLDGLDVTRAAELLATRNRQRVRVAGVKVATQTPPVKSGQRIIFLSLDDATGVSDATFFESVHDRCAWTVFHTWLLVVEGTVHRTGKRGVSINAERVWDLRRLMRAWREGWLDAAMVEHGPSPQQAGRDFDDQSPSGIEGTPGRSGLRLHGAAGEAGVAGEGFGGGGPGASTQLFSDGRQVAAELQQASGGPQRGQVNGKPLDGLRYPGLARPAGVPIPGVSGEIPAADGSNSQIQTSAARLRLPRTNPYGVPPSGDANHPPPGDEDSPRKLWHSSPGSAGG